MNARRALAAACWAGTAAVAVRGVGGSYRAVGSLRWLRRHRTVGAAGQPRRHVLLVVPMLREQRLITDTTAYLVDLAEKWGPASVVLATTEREHVERQTAVGRLPEVAQALQRRRTGAYLAARFAGVLPADELHRLANTSGDPDVDHPTLVHAAFDAVLTTPDLASRLAADSGGRVRHHHLPDPDAAMVHQINAAVAAELDRLAGTGVDPADVWIAVYNADSRPHPDTLTTLADIALDARVVQQSALFTLNLRDRAGVGGAFCDGAALLQSRWTLAREIPRLRAQARQARRHPAGRPRLAHCVGHGLFVRADTWRQLGGLPDATMNEDLAFGYLVSAAGIPIDPLPQMEYAGAPTTAWAVLRQGRQWFWSYPQYPAAAALAGQAGLSTCRGRTRLTLQGLARGALWLGQSPAVAATLLLPLTARRRGVAAAASAAGLAAYVGVPVALLTAHLRRAGIPARCGPRELAGTVAAALAGSVGPWWCLLDMARARLSGDVGGIAHDKTER